jgi:hypothetical protein
MEVHMTSFNKFKRVDIYAESKPIGGDVYIDMSKAETIEFEVHRPIKVASCGRHIKVDPIQVIHIGMNQSGYTVLNEGFSIEDLTDKMDTMTKQPSNDNTGG